MAVPWYKDEGRLLPVLYLLFALPFLSVLALITPPWQNPDEPLHMARIVQIAHGELLAYRLWGTAGGLSDRAVYDAYKPVEHAAMHPEERLGGVDLRASGAVGWSREVAPTSFPNTAQYPPVFYLPAAGVYWVGRVVGLPVDRTLLLVRLVNAGLFAAGGAASLVLARGTRPLLLAILLLPTTLALGCAASQDGLLTVAVAIAVGLVDRVAWAGRGATRAESWGVAGLLSAAAAARPPYAGFLPLVLLLWPGRRGLVLLGAAAGVVLAWCVTVALHVSVRLGGADMHRQLALLVGDPGRVPGILAHTLRHAGALWPQFIGVLGWTDTALPRGYIVAQSGVLLVAALGSHAAFRPRVTAACGVGFAVVAICVLQYLTWTWPGQDEITGVLGRYFIAPALIAALALPWRRMRRWRGAAYAAIALTACATPAVVVHAVLCRYYLK